MYFEDTSVYNKDVTSLLEFELTFRTTVLKLFGYRALYIIKKIVEGPRGSFITFISTYCIRN